MLLNILVCSLLMSLALADVKRLPATYLPPSPQEEAAVKSDVVSVKAQDVPHSSPNQNFENDLKFDKSAGALTKEASKDPAYGFPGAFPGSFINQGFPGQVYPRPVYPTGGFPGQVIPGPGLPTSQGFVNPAYPPQGFSGPNFPGQNYPGQGLPGQSFAGQGFTGQGFPDQGFPGQGFNGQGFPGQGFPLQWLPGQGFVNPGFAGQAYPNYPINYSTPEQERKQEVNNDNADNKLRLRNSHTGTQYDATNGGYLYQKPSVTF